MLITIEHGEGNPSIGTLLRISDALRVGLPPSWARVAARLPVSDVRPAFAAE